MVVCLGGCMPLRGASRQQVSLFFSAEVWGGSPFSEIEKKQVFVEALKSKQSAFLLRLVPFEILESSVLVSNFVAVYEVNARVGLPQIKSGYRVELDIPLSKPPERITLVNKLTGVSWSIRLAEVAGVN